MLNDPLVIYENGSGGLPEYSKGAETWVSVCGAKRGMILDEITTQKRLCTGKSMVRCLNAVFPDGRNSGSAREARADAGEYGGVW